MVAEKKRAFFLFACHKFTENGDEEEVWNDIKTGCSMKSVKNKFISVKRQQIWVLKMPRSQKHFGMWLHDLKGHRDYHKRKHAKNWTPSNIFQLVNHVSSSTCNNSVEI